MVTIKHKVTGVEREVSPEDWEKIQKNNLTKNVYKVMKKKAPVKADTPDELQIPEKYAGMSDDDLKAELTRLSVAFHPNAKTKTLLKLLMDADKG